MAINHCGEIDYMVYKLKYDSTHGRFEKQVRIMNYLCSDLIAIRILFLAVIVELTKIPEGLTEPG